MTNYQSQPIASILKSNLLFFSPAYRPLGGLFYKSLYGVFGFRPLPFRIACFVLLTVNLGIVWGFARALTGSVEVASLSTLIGAFHPKLVDLYWSTGTIYDILCFTFFYGALWLYISIRARGKVPNFGLGLLILVFFILALDSKEIAVALPPLMIAYELLFHHDSIYRLLSQGRVALIAAALTIPYIWGKLMPSSVLAQFDRYHPDVSLARFLQTYSAYLGDLFSADGWLTPSTTGVLLFALLLGAILLRSRVLIFAWCLAIFSALPIAFIPPRPLAAFYVPLTGWTLYIAALVIHLRTKAFRGSDRVLYRFVTLAAVLCLLLRAYRIQRLRMGGEELLRQHQIRKVVEDLDRHRVLFPASARVLAINDPFAPEQYELVLLLRLYARESNLEVDHASADDCTHPMVLQWAGVRLEKIRKAPC